MEGNHQPYEGGCLKDADVKRLAVSSETPSKPPITHALLASVEEDLPTFTEIERFAGGGPRPSSCPEAEDDCAAKMLLALTRKVYSANKAAELWRAIIDHADWMTDKLGRKPGISVAALDYLMNVSGEWDHAVVAEIEQIDTLADAAALDGLTGLYTRDFFDQWLAKAVAESSRYGEALALLMADIDDFKTINDTHGHPTGDAVLTAIGGIFLNNLRTADMAARYGGEELAALLPHTTCRSAATVAEKIRRAVDTRFEDDLGVTISIGIACWRTGMNSPDDLVQEADSALYTAKAAGKNRVVTGRAEASPDPASA